jgi:elongation factor G
MPEVPANRVRNIGIVAHIDAGKTTTSERFLFYAGKTHKLGEVHDGQAIMDFRADERKRGITISDAATTLYWADHRINLIDTPGHVDFTAEVERALRVLDGAVVVFDGVAGVEPQSETVWFQADRYEVPRIAFINKMDRVGADFDASVESMVERLAASPIPIQFPIGAGDELEGIVDLVEERYLTFEATSLGREVRSDVVPDRIADEVSQRRDALLEALAERYDPLTEAYLEGQPISPDEVRTAIREVTLQRTGVPVLCGAALRNVGIQPVLDAVCAYLPSPRQIPPVRGTDPSSGETVTRKPTSKEPFCALLFKVTADSAADLNYIRVYSGTLKAGGRTINARTGKRERLRRMLRMHAERGEQVDVVEAGDIVAAVNLHASTTGDTLCDERAPILLEPIRFPDTVVSIAVEPKTNADRDRFEDVLAKIQREDPTLQSRIDEDTGQTLLSGMGELHLEVVLGKMDRDFNLQVNHGKPRVTFRETAAGPGTGQAEYRRTVAGDDLYARVALEVEPLDPPGDPVRIVDALEPGTVPKQYLPAILESVRNAAEGGGLYGYPVTGVGITLREAAFEDVGQPEIALNSATSLAFREALLQAGSTVLEPYGKLEVRIPEDFLGGVVKTLNQRRAVVEETGYLQNQVAVRGVVPIAEMFGFLTLLRSQTQGRGSYSLEPLDFRPVPANLARDQHERLY